MLKRALRSLTPIIGENTLKTNDGQVIVNGHTLTMGYYAPLTDFLFAYCGVGFGPLLRLEMQDRNVIMAAMVSNDTIYYSGESSNLSYIIEK